MQKYCLFPKYQKICGEYQNNVASGGKLMVKVFTEKTISCAKIVLLPFRRAIFAPNRLFLFHQLV